MTLRRRRLAEGDHPLERVSGCMADTENPEPGGSAESALQQAESDLHPADPVDHLRTAEYGRESTAARRDTSDDTPTPTETPAG
jgi:hypothetical protein